MRTGCRVALLLLLLADVACNNGGATPAYDFRLLDINPRSSTHGRVLSLQELLQGRGVVLKFIASWCEQCRNELPQLESLYAAGRAPLVYVAADEQGSPESMLIVAARAGLSAPLLFVPEAERAGIEQHYAYEILPAAYLIDRQGRIRKVLQGAVPPQRLLDEIGKTLGS